MRLTTPLGLALAVVAALPAAAPAARHDVTVMSRNLYLGADLIPPATAPTVEELRTRTTRAQRNVEQTNFPVRARAIAREIDAKRPDLVGLQEVTTYRTGPQNGGRDATQPLYDWMQSLQRELRARGERYRVAVRTTVADVEVPSAENTDLRITIGDAILVRRGRRIRTSNVRTGRYDQILRLTLANGAPANFARTWESVDVRIRGRSFRFVNTHLEAFGDDIRTAQARQLRAEAFGSRRRPAILVGDLNSDPRDPPASAAAFDALTEVGFRSAFARRRPTSGFSELVNDPEPRLERVIDHILTRPRLRTIRSDVVGEEQRDRIGSLWPSDHAGVVATLRVPRRR